MSDIVKQGIEKAAEDLEKENQEKLIQEVTTHFPLSQFILYFQIYYIQYLEAMSLSYVSILSFFGFLLDENLWSI